MKANEFVKKYGWKDAKICLLNCASPEDKWFMRRGDLISGQDFDDLKQIVDAWELVFEHGSIERAKKYADSTYTAPEIKDVLVRAISLVEQCQ